MHKLYALVLVLVTGGLGAAPPTAAAAQAGCQRPPEPALPIVEVPWAQHWFGPDRVWPLSRGRGVTVAVVDTGVDTGHPQLRDASVLPGTDLLDEPAGAHVDCHSHGTAVASIIAATAVDGVGFTGLAPQAAILPVRVSVGAVDEVDPDQAEQPVAPATFARAIRWAADQGADVINLSIVFYRDHPAIADAVGYALDRDAVVVAAVGTDPGEGCRHFVPYPAAYPGVIGVSALSVEGVMVADAYAGPHVDLVAPGEAVTAARAVTGHSLWSGSSFAAPFVSAAAALVRAAEPDLTAPEVVNRLLATADPGPGSTAQSGHGTVNPYRALTERVVGGEPATAQPPPEPAADPAAQARQERWRWASDLAVLLTTAAAVLVILLLAGGAVWRLGRQRGWRPSRRGEPPPPPAADDDRQPEREFFTVPNPRDRH